MATAKNPGVGQGRGGGRPLLPVLVQEALALLWPALYAHARRHLD